MRIKSRSFVFTPVNWKTEITTEGQGYLDELAADVKTAPKAAMTGSSTFRIKCEHGGIHLDSLDVPHKPSTGDLCLVRTRVPRVSYTGDKLRQHVIGSHKWLFQGGGQQLQLRQSLCLKLQCLQIVLFTLRDPELNAVYCGTAGV